MDFSYIDDYKIKNEVIELDCTYKMNAWLEKSKNCFERDNERIECVQFEKGHIEKLGLSDIQQDVRGDINLSDFVEKYKSDIIKCKNKNIVMEIQLINISKDKQYLGNLNIGQDDKIYLIDSDDNNIEILEPTKYYAYFQGYYKIIPKQKDLMTLGEYINIIKNNNDLNKYIHKITFQDSNKGYNTRISICPDKKGLEYKDRYDKTIENIKDYFNFNIKFISICIC
ncbi:hypothetical protein N452_14560 [Clostridium botulinum A2 117]|uniref:hypothetical protein n=1 Tax=Clostridium botulinum TaxID=1491 RepID=UPI0007E0612F|nr:hypothetical protein [Clostridium botulinum]KEI79745.1 hypothetical protein N452_14560 [Clostridium botulinum A2 117]MBN3416827.1 hypothetical protein [Clostridium botulinum]MBN3443318.1 hypothetical protein [Clostridium botulinum]MBY6806955.1 hypothetical protein [Clostridium botulinum]